MPSAIGPATEGWRRRDVFRVFGLGAAGLAGLTSCGSRDSASEARAPSATDSGGNALSEFHGAWAYQLPPDGHFNLFTGLLGRVDIGPYLDLVIAPGGMWYWAEEQWLYLVCSDFQFGDNAFVYTVAKGLSWSDGETITAKDVETTFWCRWIMHQPEWAYLDGLDVTGEREVTFRLNSAASVLEYYLLRAHIFPDAIYGRFATEAKRLFESGADPDGPQVAELNNEFQSWRPGNPEDLVTSGPFRHDFDSMNDERIVLVRNSSGVLADQVPFERLVIHQGDADNVNALARSKELDYAAKGLTPETQEKIAGQGFRLVQPPTYVGGGLLFCLDQVPMFTDVRARQAMAYLIDREDASKVGIGDAAQPVESMAGMPEVFVQDWLLPGDRARLNEYRHDTARAEDLFTEAGWQREGERWVTPDGRPARFRVMVSKSHGSYRAAAERLVDQLGAFGIELELDPVAGGEIEQALAQGRFELAVHEWGAGSPHPYFCYEHDLIGDNIPGSINQLGRGIGFELTQETARYGTVDIQKLIEQAGSGRDRDKQRTQITKLAMIHNELLPRIQIFERYGNGGGLEGERVNAWPASGDPIYQNAPFSDNHAVILLYESRLEPVPSEGD